MAVDASILHMVVALIISPQLEVITTKDAVVSTPPMAAVLINILQQPDPTSRVVLATLSSLVVALTALRLLKDHIVWVADAKIRNLVVVQMERRLLTGQIKLGADARLQGLDVVLTE